MYRDNVDTLYSADDVIGITLFAKRLLTGYSLPYTDSVVYNNFKVGDRIGEVYSFISHPDGLYWQIIKPGGYFYVKHVAGNFSNLALDQQGVQTIKDKIEAQKESTTTTGDKIANQFISLTGTIKWIIIVALLAVIIFELNKHYHFINKVK
jgi:hypothetical protein